jgi:ligand-binding sensor domain-containing protein/serine phosphatase RsbU (regulator of sigma subunit)
MKIKFFFLFLFSFLFHGVFSQVYNFKNYGTKNGLVGSIVNSVFQDSKGFMWFGVQNGVSRFDGKTFKNFSKNDGLVGNNVVTIGEDKQGVIWLGTTEGISRFDGVKFKNYTKKDGLATNTIRFVFIDSKNAVWAATDIGGVAKFVNDHFEASAAPAGLNSKKVYTIAEDKKGNYWFGLDGGVAMYDGKTLTDFNEQKEIKNKTFFSSYRDSKDNIWFGGMNGSGIIKYKGQRFEQIKLPPDIENDFIGSITEDKNHNMWFACDHGVLEYDGKNFVLFNEDNGLTANQVLSVYADNENNIWIGTLSGGIDLLNTRSLSTFTKKEGLATNRINAVIYDNTNQLLVGTDLGLNIFDGHSFRTDKSLKDLTGSKILSLAQSRSGEIWMGVENKGVYVLERTEHSFVIKEHITELKNHRLSAVVKILFDKQGNSWLGDYGSGLFCINKEGIAISYSVKKGSPANNIITLFEDTQENIWIGSEEGVMKYDGKNFHIYTTKNGLASNSIWSVAEDDKHNIYFGTQDGGITAFDGKSFKTLSIKDNLCSNYIEALLWDDTDKCLWAGTDKGINKIKLKRDLTIASLRYYGEREGFKGIEVNNNAIYMDKAGLLWFGTINGLCRYNRNFDFFNSEPPRLNLNEILLDLQPVDWRKFADSVDPTNNIPNNLTLRHNKNHLTFNFQALTTDNVKYSYELEGQEGGWSPFSSSTEANFTNIAPGNTYTFRVKAISSNGVESNKNMEFTFTIKSPWWQTWWFYTLAVLLVLLSIYAITIYRTAQLDKEKRILEETVSERTKELSESNKSITDSINYAKRIQSAVMPSRKIIMEHFDNFFILYKPKDIVAGDFYWLEAVDDLVLFAVCDCTGHGVPGAMVSVVCHNALNRAVREFGLRSPEKILDKTTEIVIESFSKSEVEIKDGMDISLCGYNAKTKTLSWAGANNPLWILKNSELLEIKPDKQPIAWSDHKHSFTNHEFPINPGDKIFIFSDGFADQFGGEKLKKLTRKRFRELILSIQDLPVHAQEKVLDAFITDYRKNLEQTDDILIMGVQL